MKPIDSDSISAHGDKVLGVRPWVDVRRENLNRITISDVRSRASELRSIEAFDSTEYFNDGWYDLFNQWNRLFYSRASSKISFALRDKSPVGLPLSCSTEVFSGFKNNEGRNSDLINLLWDRISPNTSLRFPVTQSDVFTGQTDPSPQIKNATHHQEIFDILDFVGYQKITDRLKYLHEITQDDDPEDPAMIFLSLRELALFFVGDGNSLPYPQIGISPNGLLQAEWRSKKASAVMKFLTDGNTRFAGTTDNQGGRQTIQGSGTKKHALKSILPFIDYSYS